MNRVSPLRILAFLALLAAAALLQFSCDDNFFEDKDARLRITPYSGNHQSERAGSKLADPLVARVTDILGNGKPGISVAFSTYDTLAQVSPSAAVTDGAGFVSCTFRLGAKPGAQQVRAVIESDSTTFSATALDPGCSEESLEEACVWESGRVYITTTGSSLASGAGTVILRYNPETEEITKVLETATLLDGISFSSRGELFVSSQDQIHKVSGGTPALEDYVSLAGMLHLSLEPNEGSVLAGLATAGPVAIGCPDSEYDYIRPAYSLSGIQWENLAVDPVTRDVYVITKSSQTSYILWRILWDGRSIPAQSYEVVTSLTVGAAEPRGMCADSSGTIYVSFDGDKEWRRIVSVSADGAVHNEFFNFYTYYGGNDQQVGRWGDIAYLDGRLYIIDKRNDRLVIISKHGTWLDEVKDPAFSRQLNESEHYAICALPGVLCSGSDRTSRR